MNSNEVESESCMPLPQWKSHKEVYADKIIAIEPVDSGYIWRLACGAYVPTGITAELTKRSSPKVGDYFVEYDDRYKSWSPAKAFEDGYTRK